MAEAKNSRTNDEVPVEVPPERRSQRVLITAPVMEPALENTTRTANKIRDDLGIQAHRYLLARPKGTADSCAGVSLEGETVENVRVALLRALARTHAAPGRIDVLEKTTRRMLCWAEDGALFAPDGSGEISPDDVVHAERRLLAAP